MLTPQEPLDLDAPFEVVSGEDEARRLTGGEYGASIRAAYTAEVGEVAAVGKEFGEDGVEETRTEVGREGHHHQGELLHGGVLALDEELQRRVLPYQFERRGLEAFRLPKVHREVTGHELGDPVQGQLQVRGVGIIGEAVSFLHGRYRRYAPSG